MHNACIYCHRRLGANAELEELPIGRRLAFDAAKQRLWIVCPRCRKWNLPPLDVDERGEAIDALERRFRSTTQRRQSGTIGIATLRSGVDLVRIGPALWPEFASWRYGRDLEARRRWHIGRVGSSLGAAGLLAYPVMFILYSEPVLLAGVGLWTAWSIVRRPRRVVCRVPSSNGARVAVRRAHLPYAELLSHPDGGWRLGVAHDRGTAVLRDREAVRALGLVLPRFNSAGATKSDVADAIGVITELGGPEAMHADARSRPVIDGALAALDHPVRIALEMAAHEESERRALAGELALLEAEWREAEEIAGIVDQLDAEMRAPDGTSCLPA